MIVEDDAPLREILQVLLEDYPHDFLFAENGRQALELDHAHSPELIMIDLGLPDMHGFDLGQEIRRRDPSGGRRLIAFTGFDSEEHRRKARSVGFDDFYLKPMDLESMERTFAEILADPA
jgi:DNA-binding response OmpR family regulator